MKERKSTLIFKWTYKTLRSIILSLIVLSVTLYTLVYILISIPPVQNIIKERIEKELSIFLGNNVEIGNIDIIPMNEVIINDALFFDSDGKECLEISRLGSGINLWRLLFTGYIEITYVELLDFKAEIYQKTPESPLNIDFFIKAFQPKQKNKPPTKFDLKIHNIVIRKGTVKFDRLWTEKNKSNTIDFNHLYISNLSGDITIPRLSNDFSEIDLRRIAFNEKSGFQIKDIDGLFTLNNETLTVDNLNIKLPQTTLKFAEFSIPFSYFNRDSEDKGLIQIKIENSNITPSNFSAFFPQLEEFNFSLPIGCLLNISKNEINIERFVLGDNQTIKLQMQGLLKNISNKEKFCIDLKALNLKLNQESANIVLSQFPKISNNESLHQLVNNIGNLELYLTGNYSLSENILSFKSEISTHAGSLMIESSTAVTENQLKGKINVSIPDLNFQTLVKSFPINSAREAFFDFDGIINLKNPLNSDGEISFGIGEIEILNRNISTILGRVEKLGKQYGLSLKVNDSDLKGTLDFNVTEDKENTVWGLHADIEDFDTFNSFLADSEKKRYEFAGKINAEAIGNTLDNITGHLDISDIKIQKYTGKSLDISNLNLKINQDNSDKQISFNSDFASLNLTGCFYISKIPGMITTTLYEVLPSIFPYSEKDNDCGNGKFQIEIVDAKPLIDFFDFKIFPLTELSISGNFNSDNNEIGLYTEIPYIQQGENKLITDSYLNINVIGKEHLLHASSGTIYPTKKGLLKLDLDLTAKNGVSDISINFNEGRDVSFKGDVFINAIIEKDPISNQFIATVKWLPSQLSLNEAVWNLEESEIIYSGDNLTIKDFCVRHQDQYVIITGFNNIEGNGDINILLSEINLDYIFDTLNINHVTFGGFASGEIKAQNLLTGNPNVFTHNLFARDLSYNGSVLGDGDLRASLNMEEKKIAIGALIKEKGENVAEVDGGVWFGKDSLSFDFIANHVNIGFMQPFMQAFSSDVRGKASGKAKLYGTFSDIDMVGVIAAENADILIDYINTRYTGSDTVYLHPGRIHIPHFIVKDPYGHTAKIEGELEHRYFHEPSFRFQISEMDNLMVYNTTAKINPLWYGKIFASGNGRIIGRPGAVNIGANVETDSGSEFTFVLSDQQEAIKSQFLSFSDKRKEMQEEALKKDSVPSFLEKFRQKINKPEETPDIFSIDFRVSVTDDVRFNLIMDPIAGDKIVAYGTGAMNMTYTSLTDELKLYGKYTLDKGSYNFSLQDIILKEFTIKPGSSIAFTGNPYTGILNITAAYKVNTSLTELDQSFANDRELNRTSVPVEALLKVSGILTSPTIDFDIELPTVTEETAQKVRSIISTEDMMSRQVLYLVALNKFYPPEYMTTSNSGGEWASIASSTISSQIQNMIGQITDKFTLSPSFRSDKGDFSDIEVDLALSSQLFHNRLLINGNIGYRDPSNSSTTFVGDFDLEYLLNRKGTWRLKAYNHFNDQNYYLKSALTTQGIGIIWRKDFGLPHKKETEQIETTKEADTK